MTNGFEYGMSALLVVLLAFGASCRGEPDEPAPDTGDVKVADDTTDGTGDVDDASHDAADGGLTSDDCASDEMYVENTCLQCGPADGCQERGPDCLKTCEVMEDCNDAFGERISFCQDGTCRRGCG